MMSSNGFMAMADRVFPATDEGAGNGVEIHRSYSSSSNAGSEPLLPPDSPVSCVSSRLQEEYDELLKYAVVVPTYNPLRSTLPAATAAATGFVVASGDAPASATEVVQKQAAVTTAGGGGAKAPPGTKSKPAVSKDRRQQPLADNSSEEEQDRLSAADDHRHGRPIHHWLNLEGTNQEARVGHDYGNVAGCGSVDGMHEESSSCSYTVTVDQDVSHMDALMDEWTAELKQKVMAEFSQTKIRILEHHRNQMMKQKDVYAGDMRQQVNEAEALKELLHTYEQSIERKDQVITNLTASLQSHRDKMDIQRSFCEWKIKHNDTKREGFASNLAYRHYHRTLQRKVWDAWHSLVETRWRQRVEKACQAKAQEVCIALTNDYETKLASLNEALEAARTEVQRLHRERNLYEETMKKAFMRGVCALNLEAMTMFHEGDKGPEQKTKQTEDDRRRDEDQDDDRMIGSSTTIQQECVYSSVAPSGPAPPRVVTLDQQKSRPGGGGAGAKVISAKITARPVEVVRGAGAFASGPGFSVMPPMSSVIVEKHQPVTKQTIGQATASKYQRSGFTQPSAQHRRANQGTGILAPTPNIQTIKVVE